MKKLLLVPATLLSFMIAAQSTIQLKDLGTNQVLAPNAIVQRTTFASSNVKVNIDIKNTSNSPQSYTVKRYDVHLNSANGDTAAAYFCFGGSCYGAGTIVSPSNLHLQAGKSANDTAALYYFLTADLDEAPTVGLSLVKYTFFNVNNTTDSVQVTIKYNNGNVGINAINKDLTAIDIFPNPATESAFLKISAVKAIDTKLTIYNALGAVVTEKAILINEGKNNVDLKAENLSPGIYFVNLKTNDASVTKRLIVK